MRSKLNIPVIVVILLFVNFASGVMADQKWLVQSEYTSQIPGQQLATVTWVYDSLALGDGSIKWEVEDREKLIGCRAELFFTASGLLEQADCYRQVQSDEVCDARLYDVRNPALLGQTLIPGDWLNVKLPFTYQVHRRKVALTERIGITVFVNNVEMNEQSLSRAEAYAKGMIRDDLQQGLAADVQLCLVDIVRIDNNGNSDILLQQLWRAGDNFWLYEAKAGRRSWRVLPK